MVLGKAIPDFNIKCERCSVTRNRPFPVHQQAFRAVTTYLTLFWFYLHLGSYLTCICHFVSTVRVA